LQPRINDGTNATVILKIAILFGVVGWGRHLGISAPFGRAPFGMVRQAHHKRSGHRISAGSLRQAPFGRLRASQGIAGHRGASQGIAGHRRASRCKRDGEGVSRRSSPS